MSFCKVGVFLSERSPITFRTVCTKIIKTIAHNPKRRRQRFRKKSKAVFFSVFGLARHLKRRRQRAKVPNIAFEKYRSQNVTRHLNKIHVLFHVERSQQILKTASLFATKESSRAELKKTFLERAQRRFGKFLFCSRNKSCFYNYSISQDISNAGC